MPSDMILENDELVVFKDIYPKAKHHLLIVPKKHIPTINDLNENEADEQLIGKMALVARDLAKEMNLSGYKLQFNVGESGGQVVFHIHLHLMSEG